MNKFHFECMLRHQLCIYSLKQASTSMKDCEPSQATVLSLLKLILMLNEEEKESQEYHVPAGSGLSLQSTDKTSAMKSTREKFFGQNSVRQASRTESDGGGRKRTVEGGDPVTGKKKMSEVFDDTNDLCPVDASLRDAASLYEKPSHSTPSSEDAAMATSIGRRKGAERSMGTEPAAAYPEPEVTSNADVVRGRLFTEVEAFFAQQQEREVEREKERERMWQRETRRQREGEQEQQKIMETLGVLIERDREREERDRRIEKLLLDMQSHFPASGASDSRAVFERPAPQVPPQPQIETLSEGSDAQEVSAGDNSGTDDGAQRQADGIVEEMLRRSRIRLQEQEACVNSSLHAVHKALGTGE